VVAGQSYATNCNDEKLSVTDPQKRVVAFDTAKGTWSWRTTRNRPRTQQGRLDLAASGRRPCQGVRCPGGVR